MLSDLTARSIDKVGGPSSSLSTSSCSFQRQACERNNPVRSYRALVCRRPGEAVAASDQSAISDHKLPNGRKAAQESYPGVKRGTLAVDIAMIGRVPEYQACKNQ